MRHGRGHAAAGVLCISLMACATPDVDRGVVGFDETKFERDFGVMSRLSIGRPHCVRRRRRRAMRDPCSPHRTPRINHRGSRMRHCGVWPGRLHGDRRLRWMGRKMPKGRGLIRSGDERYPPLRRAQSLQAHLGCLGSKGAGKGRVNQRSQNGPCPAHGVVLR